MKKNTLFLILGLLVVIVVIFGLANSKEKTVKSESHTGEVEHGGFFGFVEGLFSGVNLTYQSE